MRENKCQNTVRSRMVNVPANGINGAEPKQIEVDLGALSHCGKVRTANEDCFLVARFDRMMQVMLSNVPEGLMPDRHASTVYGMLVADGIGGAPAGGVASRTAVSALVDLVIQSPDWIMQLNEATAQQVAKRAASRFRQLEEALSERTQSDPRLAGMGTTMTVACSYGPNLLVSHVGHSRAYLFHGGQLQRLTRDHTMAQALATAGVIGNEDIATHPFRRVLTNSISTKRAKAQAELHQLQLMDGDQVLLCTNGLTDMVSEARIVEALQKLGSSAEACRILVELALEGGGKDNVTVVLARYRIPK